MKQSVGVMTIGDAMITFNPSVKGPLRYVSHFERKVGGAELNFAIGCARLGVHSKWVSRLGHDEFGRFIYNFVRGEGVDVSDVHHVEGYPTSLNFKEIHEDGSGKTFYYRSNSPILTLNPDDITEAMFEGIGLVHLSGVYLAIDPKNKQIVDKVISVAKAKGIKISFDPNIRLKLWTIEEARKTFFELFPFVDVLLTGRDELSMILDQDHQSAFETFVKDYNIEELIIKDGANGSKLYANNQWYEQKSYSVHAVDTVGAGDGFDAGYIYALLNKQAYSERLMFANGVGALVTTVSGDNEGLPYLDEVSALIHQEAVIER